jgi:hypothetical protein
MASNDIDKGLYAAPVGMEEMMDNMLEPDIEIEIEDPEEVTIRAGGMEIEIDPENEQNDEFNINLAEELDDKVLEMLVGRFVR